MAREHNPDLKVAVVHPWVVEVRGAERVFFDIADTLPSADVFLLHANRSNLPPNIANRVRSTTFLDNLPYSRMSYRAMLPMLPRAAESIDLSNYDLVVSCSYGWAHGVRVGDNTTHVCYMHSPPRYLWGEDPPTRSSRAIGTALRPLLNRLRRWDEAAAENVDSFLANSKTTAERIARSYGRDSEVVYPPVDTAKFSSLERDPNGYLITIGELVPYKRFDLAIAAARANNAELVLVGDGPERRRLETLAEGTRVRFAGRTTNEELLDIMAGARALLHPGVEDFGIVMVEALAAGIPVIGPNDGGAKEIVPAYAGSLVNQLDESAFAGAVADVDARSFDDLALRDRATQFSRKAFAHRFVEAIARESIPGIPTRTEPLNGE